MRRSAFKMIFGGIAWLLLILFAPGHAGAQPTGTVSSQLTAGATTVGAAEVQRLGLIGLLTFTAGSSQAVFCSGVLLTNQWVLTAGHCLDALTGKTTQVFVIGQPAIFTMNALYKFGVGSQDTTGPDMGLIQLSSPMPNGGFTNRFFTRLNRSDPTGKSVTLYGASTNAYLKTTSTVQGPSGPSNHNLVLTANSTGSTTTQGDSGGPTFLSENGQTLLVGLTTATNGTITAIHPHVAWLLAATRSFLDQTQPFASTTTLIDEFRALPEGDKFSGKNTTIGENWQAIARIVMMMCTKRGFIGGTLIPDRTSQDRLLKFACIGRSGGAVVDATQAQLDATGSGFSDIGAVGWARGARAANAICHARSGMVGGFLTGAPGSNGTGQAVVCVNASAGQTFGANPDQLPDIGRADIDQAAWLAGRVDASDFCRSFGYDGGLSDGIHVPSGIGVVCIGRKSIELGGFTTTTPPDVLARRRALYAVSLDEPLLAPAGAASGVPMGFKPCHDLLLPNSVCPVVPDYRQWAYDLGKRRLLHVDSGKCVAVAPAPSLKVGAVVLQTCVGAPSESWTVSAPAGSGVWRIKSDASTLCLTAFREAAGAGPGRRVTLTRAASLVQRPCSGTDAQAFNDVDANWRPAQMPR